VPQITRPHPLYGVASGELGKDGVYPVTKPDEENTPFGIRVSLLGGVQSQKRLKRVVVAVSDEKAQGGLGDLWKHVGSRVCLENSFALLRVAPLSATLYTL